MTKKKELAEAVLLSCPALESLSGQEWEFVTDDPEESLEMLLELKACEAEHVMEWPQGEKLKVRSETGFDNLSLKIKKERDWFKATGALQIDGDLSLDLKKLLEELRSFSAGHGKGVRFAPLAAPALEGLTQNLTSLETDRAWKDHVKRLNQVIQPKIPGTLQAKLRDYQVEGFNWLAQLAHWGVGGCLADDMGLGKTVQAIAAVLPGASKGPSLVVAPLSVMANWQDECRRFAPTPAAVSKVPSSGCSRMCSGSFWTATTRPWSSVSSWAILPFSVSILKRRRSPTSTWTARLQ